MAWSYRQSTGELYDSMGNLVDTGYSGAQPYVNDPLAEARVNEGPIPTGSYTIFPGYDHDNLGPQALPLGPSPMNNMHERSDFYIHGDTPEGDQTASKGCIILSRATRDLIDASADNTLIVTVT
jgi:Tlde1 domain